MSLFRRLFADGATLVNVAALLAQILEAIPPRPWVMVAQAVLQALLPSFAGTGRRVVLGKGDGKDR